MFKSVFTRYIISFVLIFIVSFLCFGTVIYGYVSEYARNEVVEHVRSASRSTKITLDTMFENYFSNEEEILGEDGGIYSAFLSTKKSDIDTAISGIAKFTGIGILIVDSDGTVVSSTAKKYLGLKVKEGFYQGEYTSSVKMAVDGVVDTPCYVSTVPLSDGEGNYVLAFNLSDSDREILLNIVQAVSAAAIVVFLFGFAACYLISYKMITPLKEMSKAAKKFALGDFNARVPVEGRDEIAELAEAFNNMAQSLADLEEQRSSFLANISHDLRTPMTSISGFIDGILDGTIPPENRDHYLNIINVEVKRLSRLVRTLLEVSRIEAGVRKFNMTSFDICEMSMTILFSFEKQIDGKELDVEYLCEKDHLFVKADADAIYQVMYNLIDNAVKFSYPKGKLRIAVENVGKTISVEVYNEGNGISKEDIPHVFDRFYKADKSRGMDKTGVGLGLFIAKAILQAHGENITVTSEEGKYCSFKMTLPKGEQISPERRRRNTAKADEEK